MTNNLKSKINKWENNKTLKNRARCRQCKGKGLIFYKEFVKDVGIEYEFSRVCECQR